MTSSRLWLAAVAGGLLVAAPPAALAQALPAQSWPERAIQAIVPFAAGAANDIVGRIVLEQVSKQINQPIVIENRPGASGTLGVNAVAKAAPNGYTILVHSSSFSMEVMAGRIDFYFLPLAPALPLVKEGQLIALAVSTDTRATALPDVPTTTELGLKDSSYLFWTGFFVHAKTPRDIIGKLYDESRKAMQVAAVQERLAKTGAEPMPMTVEEFERYFREDVLSTAKLMQQIGIKPAD